MADTQLAELQKYPGVIDFLVDHVARGHLLGVLTAPGATLDSIHLSSKGHAPMAKPIGNLVGEAFAIVEDQDVSR